MNAQLGQNVLHVLADGPRAYEEPLRNFGLREPLDEK